MTFVIASVAVDSPSYCQIFQYVKISMPSYKDGIYLRLRLLNEHTTQPDSIQSIQ